MTPFIRGFLKQASLHGIAEQDAYSLCKLAADFTFGKTYSDEHLRSTVADLRRLYPQMPKATLSGSGSGGRGLLEQSMDRASNGVMQHPERLLKGTLAGGVTAAGLDYFAPTPENNGSYGHDVLNQFNDSAKRIVAGGTAGALAGGVGAVPGAIGGGIYDVTQKAVTGGRDLFDIGKMKFEAGGQQQAIAALKARLEASKLAKPTPTYDHNAAVTYPPVLGNATHMTQRELDQLRQDHNKYVTSTATNWTTSRP